MEKDQRELLSVFNDRNVRYLIVGGYASSHYAEPRATKDLDLFIDPSAENSRSVFAALAEYGAPLGGITPNDFQNVNSIYQIGQPSARIDILQHIDISVQDLIRNKLAVGRLRDLADVEDIRDALAATSHPTEPNDE